MRIREAGDSALLLELEAVIDAQVNAQAIAAAQAMRDASIDGVRDVVSTYRSVAVYFDPLRADASVVRTALERASHARGTTAAGRTIEVPVVYGGDAGPDLAEVAAFAGLSVDAVVERHAGAEYRVFLLGFLPGFAYMGAVPQAIAAPRRATPRLRVAAGSVGIAGPQTAVYPRDSPGGWQIIGRTALQVFDPEKSPAALFAPGDTVRFVATTNHQPPTASDRPPATSHPPAVSGSPVRRSLGGGGSRTVTVLRPGLFTTIQDAGRWGHQSSGVPVSGAVDLVSHRTANALVGNAPEAATIEATLIGPELRVDAVATIAVTGADLGATLDGAPMALHAPLRCRPGSTLQFSERRAGARAYVAFDGGIAVPPVLGSRATHAVAGLGGFDGRPLAAGACLPLAPSSSPPARQRLDLPRAAGGGVRVRVVPGPQDDWFPDEAFELLQRQRFRVSAHSDRMGYRLQGGRIPRLPDREMISDATFPGAIQVPGSGEPIVLMADRQTTGGYPQIGVVITADLPLAAQLAPGDWIEFQVCTRSEALAALVAQEGKLLAIQ